MQITSFRRIVPWVLFSSALMLLVYTGMRADRLSMTIDESNTYLNFKDTDLSTCFSSPDCWSTANNHLLNTFLMQQSVKIFGVSEFSLRLPNVLAHLLYLICSIWLVFHLSKQGLLQLAGFAILNLNPYLLDFFSLCRGYGLCVAFVLLSLLQYYRYLQGNRPAALWWTFGALIPAVLANFIALAFFAALWGLHLFLLLAESYRKEWPIRQSVKHFFKQQAAPLATAIIIGLLVYRPILFLQEKGEFLFGASQLMNTFRLMAADTLYGKLYLGEFTIPVFEIAAGSLILSSIVLSFRGWYRNTAARFHWAMSILLLVLLEIMILQHQLLGSEYLVNRKALLFFPVMGLILWLGLEHLYNTGKTKAAFILSSCLLLWWTIHFGRSMNLRSAREWNFDEYTREMLYDVKTMMPAGKEKVSLGLKWIFMPTAEFYWQTRKIDWIEPLKFESDLHPDKGYDFYYVEHGDLPTMQDKYQIAKDYFWGKYLMVPKGGEWSEE